MRKFLADYIDGICLLAGCGLIIYGLSILSAALAWIGAGIMLVVFSLIIGKVMV